MSRTEFTLRATLAEADWASRRLAALAGTCLPPERLVQLEIAAAEALSNIVRQGYDGKEHGGDTIALAVPVNDTTTIEIRDRGRPVPAGSH